MTWQMCHSHLGRSTHSKHAVYIEGHVMPKADKSELLLSFWLITWSNEGFYLNMVYFEAHTMPHKINLFSISLQSGLFSWQPSKAKSQITRRLQNTKCMKLPSTKTIMECECMCHHNLKQYHESIAQLLVGWFGWYFGTLPPVGTRVSQQGTLLECKSCIIWAVCGPILVDT